MKKIRKQENGLKSEEEDLVQQLKTHKDEIVEKLLSMVRTYDTNEILVFLKKQNNTRLY